MRDPLYDTDILGWSRTQAARLRRLAAGERVNDIDWAHVIEEVEDVGKSELKSVRSLFQLAILHALKAAAWPDHGSAAHWTDEISNVLLQGRARFEPGMRRSVDAASLYADPLIAVRAMRMPGAPGALPLPDTAPFTLADLRDPRFGAADLLDRVRAAQAPMLTPPPAPTRPRRGTPKPPRSAG